jgi:hypothetical protein
MSVGRPSCGSRWFDANGFQDFAPHQSLVNRNSDGWPIERRSQGTDDDIGSQ